MHPSRRDSSAGRQPSERHGPNAGLRLQPSMAVGAEVDERPIEAHILDLKSEDLGLAAARKQESRDDRVETGCRVHAVAVAPRS